MRVIVPEYYKEFKCIASKCKNNCCIGWEIDIDKDTYELYKSFRKWDCAGSMQVNYLINCINILLKRE